MNRKNDDTILHAGIKKIRRREHQVICVKGTGHLLVTCNGKTTKEFNCRLLVGGGGEGEGNDLDTTSDIFRGEGGKSCGHHSNLGWKRRAEYINNMCLGGYDRWKKVSDVFSPVQHVTKNGKGPYPGPCPIGIILSGGRSGGCRFMGGGRPWYNHFLYIEGKRRKEEWLDNHLQRGKARGSQQYSYWSITTILDREEREVTHVHHIPEDTEIISYLFPAPHYKKKKGGFSWPGPPLEK